MLEATPSYPQPVSRPAADSSFSVALPRRRRVAIIGFGATAKDAPWLDPSWELWAMNGWWRAAKPDFGVEVPEERYALWFDMHTAAFTREYGKQAGFGDAQNQWLQKPHPFPVFMLDEAPEYPSARAFPIAEVVDQLGRDYFTSTVAYAIAYAQTLPDVGEIGLWGIDLCHSSEYTDQRPCAEYWIARAEAAGVKITVAHGSALLKQRQRYGYQEGGELYRDMRAMLTIQAKGLEQAIEKRKAEQEALMAQLHTDDGALQSIRATLDRLEIYSRGGRV